MRKAAVQALQLLVPAIEAAIDTDSEVARVLSEAAARLSKAIELIDLRAMDS